MKLVICFIILSTVLYYTDCRHSNTTAQVPKTVIRTGVATSSTVRPKTQWPTTIRTTTFPIRPSTRSPLGTCTTYCSWYGTRVAGFRCPERGQSPSLKYCCGNEYYKYCCRRRGDDISHFPPRYSCRRNIGWKTAMGVLGLILLILLCTACICQFCDCGRSRRERRSMLNRQQSHTENTDLSSVYGAVVDPTMDSAAPYNPQFAQLTLPSYDEITKEPPKYQEIFGVAGCSNQAFVEETRLPEGHAETSLATPRYAVTVTASLSSTATAVTTVAAAVATADVTSAASATLNSTLPVSSTTSSPPINENNITSVSTASTNTVSSVSSNTTNTTVSTNYTTATVVTVASAAAPSATQSS